MNARIVFIDESGLLMAPLVKRTWSLKGQTPILYQRTRSHKKVSIIAALSVAPHRQRVGLYFSLYSDLNITSSEIIRFLDKLRHQIQKPIIIVWDRLRAHQSKRIHRFAERKPNLKFFLLPPYAPELNPVELIWGYLKYHALPNYTANEVLPLSRKTRYQACRLRKKPDLLRSFLYKTPLFSCPE
jgi:transposase